MTVFEAKEQAGGLNTYGIVSFRLPQAIALWEVEQIRQLGVDIRTNIRVGLDIMPEQLLKDYDAVVLAVGMSKVPMLGIEGEQLEGVLDAIDFVESTKTDISMDLVGKRVAVIGAGNTAIDAATCSVRMGAEQVQILYRRSEKEMTAYDFEYEFAKQDGVVFQWFTAPKRVIGDDAGPGRWSGMYTHEAGAAEGTAKARPVEIEGSEWTMPVDAVIKAIGQTRYLPLVEQFELEHTRGIVQIDSATYQTSNPHIYAAGDVMFGEGQGEAMVVSAAQQGKLAAYPIYKQLISAQSEPA